MSGTLNISARIEALLFYKGEPAKVAFLAEVLKATEDDVRTGLDMLETELLGRGVRLLRNDDEVTLGTTPVMSSLIEGLIKEELSKDLGKAGLETLAIVLYRGPVARSEINYIRGVNSNYILRSLLVRGLIEKVESSARSTIYRPTFELLSYMGVSKVEDLPEYGNVHKEVEEFINMDKEKNDNEERESVSKEA